MKIVDVKKLPLGIYTIEWKSGGTSVATIGMTESGGRWLAPANWTFPSDNIKVWRKIKSLHLIKE